MDNPCFDHSKFINEKGTATGYNWILQDINYDLYNKFTKYNVSELLSMYMATKKDLTEDNFYSYLDPKIKNIMPDPFSLKSMDLAVEFVINAIKNNKNIVIFADYDVDGASSAALMYLFLEFLGCKAKIYVPDRIKEGYGPNSNALMRLREEGADLIITVDCGTVAFEPLQKAADIGLDIIVIDHHIGVKEIPSSIAVINPNRYDEQSDLTYLCGAGVAFMFCTALAKQLQNGDKINKDITLEQLSAKLLSLTDLVALATVCDMVPLVGVNRALVKTGLKIINKRNNIGIRTLADTGGLGYIQASHLGFVIGPMINAGGRLGDATLGAKILSTNDEEYAKETAKQLANLSQKRSELEIIAVREAVDSISVVVPKNQVIISYSADWHQGITGIIASRIKDKYYLPTIIGSIVEEEGQKVVKASCRSITGVDIGRAILEAVNNNLLIKGGGHAAAAGFTAQLDKMDQLKNFLHEKLSASIEYSTKTKVFPVNHILELRAINDAICEELMQLHPFGIGNNNPLFVSQNVMLWGCKILKNLHISMMLKCPQSNIVHRAIAFRCVDHNLGTMLLEREGTIIDLAMHIEPQLYLGKLRPNIIVQDIC